jgi:hypothetical protein
MDLKFCLEKAGLAPERMSISQIISCPLAQSLKALCKRRSMCHLCNLPANYLPQVKRFPNQ